MRFPKNVHGFKPLTGFAKSSILNIWQCSYLSLPWASKKFQSRSLWNKHTAWKVSKYRFFSGPYLPVFGLKTWKYGPKKTPYLDTFHAVALFKNVPTFQIKQKQVRKSIKLKEEENKIFQVTNKDHRIKSDLFSVDFEHGWN